ncbi:hypothetical protein F2Q68_00040246 [Brassica cretica]|uniref:Uncharacterized protein n=1 Tax=Brassica cretica TaxID=69181 RepID=A0A8S9MGL0_BRACR|nr:hypothetical protein F2Q68_00040246 [Brassica cretica]
MAQDDATFSAPGGEPTPTPEAAPPVPSDFMSSVMARLARQDEVQKTTNDQLVALVATLTAPNGQTSRPQMISHRLFNTNPTAMVGDHISDDSEPNETLLADAPPIGPDLATIRDIAELKLSFQQMSSKIHQATSAAPQIESDDGEEDSSADEEQPANRRRIEVILSQQTLSSDDENDDTPILGDLRDVLKRKLDGDFKFEPLKAKPKNGKSWSKNKERRGQRKATGKGRQNKTQQQDEDKTLKDDGEEDSSADEEQPANRRRIEVILSQQTLSSDDENDDTPILGDLRDVLKRKLESEDDNSSEHSDLRLTLNARKSHRISTGDPDPKEHPKFPNGDLRDKLNAGACNLRILLNRSKPTYLRNKLRLTGKGRQNKTQQQDEDKNLKDDGEEDSSADEEQPANRRRIEVILSQQTLSSDDENDDTPILGDLRDVLKRKLESEDSDLRLTLNVRKKTQRRRVRSLRTSQPLEAHRSPKTVGTN